MGPGDRAKYLTRSLWSGFRWAADFAAGGEGCAHRLFSVDNLFAAAAAAAKKFGRGEVVQGSTRMALVEGGRGAKRGVYEC